MKKTLRATSKIVSDDAKPHVPYGPAANGHARSSVRPFVDGRGTGVRGGSARYPYYGWLEFGGRVGRDRSVRRNRIKGGRYLYPSLGRNRRRIRRELVATLVRSARRAGLHVIRHGS